MKLFITSHRTPAGALLLLAVALALFLTGCGPNREIGYQARLAEADGDPVTGNRSVAFRLWSCETCTDAANLEFEETQTVAVADGLLSAAIGSVTTNGIDPAIFAQPLWLEVVVEGETLTPRQKLSGAPYAMSLPGGAVIGSLLINRTDPNKGALNVVNGADGTVLMLAAVDGEGATDADVADLIRGCDTDDGTTCAELVFRATAKGNLKIDGAVTSPAADFAEMMRFETAGRDYSPGDVLVISRTLDRAVALSDEPYASEVIGVYSTEPAFVGGSAIDEEELSGDTIPVAIVGIVPVKVSAENGAIRRGDLLTTASLAGHAMKATVSLPGTILGKAMGELLSGTGVIEVYLMPR